jgi:MFS family permease
MVSASTARHSGDMKLNTNLLWSAAVAALGGFLFGFDTAVISGATDALRLRFVLDSNQLGFTVASALIGTIVGSIAAGAPSEKYGRRPVLKTLAVLYFLSAAGCAFAPNWTLLLVSRFIGGLAIGASSVVAPMYIAEISPPALRGRLVALSQFNVVAGILAAYFSNYIIATIVGGPAAWRWMLGIAAVPAVLFFLLLLRIAESPRSCARWATRRPTHSSATSPTPYTRKPCRRTSPSSSESTAGPSSWRSWSRPSISSRASTR